MKEKQLYVIIIVLAVALAGVSGYLIAIVLGSVVSVGRSSGSAVYPAVRIGWEQEAQFKTIAVVGMGAVSAKPNLVELRLGAVSEAVTATEALKESADSVNGVIGALKAMGIPEEDIETAYFQLYPRYDGYRGVEGFDVTHILRVTTTNLDRIGEIIDKAVSAGANTVQMVQYTFTEEKLRELNEQTRQDALEDAKAKAETIAASLEVEIVGVAGADEAGYYPYYDSWRSYMSYTYGGFYAVPAPPGPIFMPPTEVEVTVTIRVTYIIE